MGRETTESEFFLQSHPVIQMDGMNKTSLFTVRDQFASISAEQTKLKL
jgi:hypothetical protein